MAHFVRRIVFFCIACSAILCACNSGNDKQPDTSAIQVNLSTSRFDIDLTAIDTNHIGTGLEKLAVKYPDFLNFFLDTVMGLGIHGNFKDAGKGIDSGLRVYLTYKDFVLLEDTVKSHYPDTKDVEAQIVSCFKNMKYYNPQFHIPRIYYVNTELNNLPAFTIDTSIVGISLDMFLGDNFVPYTQVQIPAYMFPHLRPSYIPVAVFKVIYSNSYPFVQEDKVLLDMMLQRGREFYFLHKIMPNTPDSVIFGFSQRQVDWCEHNEEFIYNYFITQNLLYEKELTKTLPYINDGPFARGIGSAADSGKFTPGNIGSWLGYRMVCSYIKHHPEVDLRTLSGMKKEPNIFIEEAKYKPK